MSGSDSKKNVTSVKGYRRGSTETGKYDKNTGIVKFINLPEYIIYEYDVGLKNRKMPVKIINITSSSYRYYSNYSNWGTLNLKSSPASISLKAEGDNVISVGTERDEDIVNVKPGDLTFVLGKTDGSEEVYVNDVLVEDIEIEDGKFTLPAEIVKDGISVQVRGSELNSEVLNINVIE